MNFLTKICVIFLVDGVAKLLSDSFFSGAIAGTIAAYICMFIDDFSNNSVGEHFNNTLSAIEAELQEDSEKDIIINNLIKEKDTLKAEIKDLKAKIDIADGKNRIAFEKVDAYEKKYQALNKDYVKLEHENNRIWKLLEEEKNRA